MRSAGGRSFYSRPQGPCSAGVPCVPPAAQGSCQGRPGVSLARLTPQLSGPAISRTSQEAWAPHWLPAVCACPRSPPRTRPGPEVGLGLRHPLLRGPVSLRPGPPPQSPGLAADSSVPGSGQGLVQGARTPSSGDQVALRVGLVLRTQPPPRGCSPPPEVRHGCFYTVRESSSFCDPEIQAHHD